jgi:hypothetical protein
VPDYVRVATFEADDAAIDAMVQEISSAPGPPPDVPGKSIVVLADRAAGIARIVVRFGSQEDLEKGSAALDAMSPPEAASVRRVSVEKFEVLLDRSA